MTTVTISDVLGDLQAYVYNPAAMMTRAIDVLEKVTDGTINIVDPSNPFVYSLENTAVNTAAFMQENEARTRRLYPAAANSFEDLYYHMSDKDYIDRFAKPTTADFTIILPKADLINCMEDEPITGNKKLVIPRNTVFTVASVSFSLQYPVELKLLSHGGIQITYDTSVASPLLSLSTNLIDFEEIKDANNTEWIKFNVTATQFFVDTSYTDVSVSAGYYTDIPLTDQYYYARCYVIQSDDTWKEIETTHNADVHDPSTPVAVIRVMDGMVRVMIPIIYTTNGSVTGRLRMDIYQTKGSLNMAMKNYSIEQYSAKFYNIDTNDNDKYNAAVTKISTMLIYSTSTVGGGRDELTFQELKDRVISNSIGPQLLPITNTQLQSSVQDLGYDIIKNVDTVTNRIYIASRALPAPEDKSIYTSASATMNTLTASMDTLAKAYGAYDNGNTVTLTSSALYRNVDGITAPLSTVDYNALTALSLPELCKTVTDGGYYFSPFTYVYDTSGKVFEVRPYYLDNPKIKSKSFIAANETTGYQVSISTIYNIVKVTSGYEVTIKTSSTVPYRNLLDSQVFAQMALKSPNQSGSVYLLGTLIGKDPDTSERYFKFKIDTNYHLDADDNLELTSFKSDTNGLAVLSSLIQDLDVYFITTATMPSGYTLSTLDSKIGDFQFDTNVHPVAISHEKIRVEFGQSLKALWVQSRSIVSSVPYKVYQSNVPAYYKQNVYQIDPTTGTAFSVVNGQLVYNILHKKGDPVIDESGAQAIEHYRGEVMLDDNGDPILEDGYAKYMTRVVDIFMIEGAYYFANSSVIKSYMSLIKDSVTQWIVEDMTTYKGSLLDQTRIYFQPKTNAGNVKILTPSNTETTITSSQSLKVKLYVNPTVYADDALKAELTKTTIKTIDTQLQNSTVTVDSIQDALLSAYAGDVISVIVTGLGGAANNFDALTVIDNNNRLSLGKRLIVLDDNSLSVEEAVTITFSKHGSGA